MKRLVSILFIAILFASCSSDDDSPSQKSIVGAWILAEANVENAIDINGDGSADRNFLKEVPCFVGTLAFTGDGNFSQTFSEVASVTFECIGTVANSGTYTLNGDQLTTTISGPEPTTETRTVDLNGNTLKSTFEIGSLGDVELVYKRN